MPRDGATFAHATRLRCRDTEVTYIFVVRANRLLGNEDFEVLADRLSGGVTENPLRTTVE